jgi:hypothetical protein
VLPATPMEIGCGLSGCCGHRELVPPQRQRQCQQDLPCIGGHHLIFVKTTPCKVHSAKRALSSRKAASTCAGLQPRAAQPLAHPPLSTYHIRTAPNARLTNSHGPSRPRCRRLSATGPGANRRSPCSTFRSVRGQDALGQALHVSRGERKKPLPDALDRRSGRKDFNSELINCWAGISRVLDVPRGDQAAFRALMRFASSGVRLRRAILRS